MAKTSTNGRMVGGKDGTSRLARQTEEFAGAISMAQHTRRSNSGSFIRSQSIKMRFIKILKVYLVWSAIYLPLTVCGYFAEGRSALRYLIVCLRNYVLVGENFYSWTLWYLNGLIFALFLINVLLKKFSIKQIAGIGVFVYLIGIVLTILNSHLERLPLFLERPVDLYFSLFVTTRNGLFQSLVFMDRFKTAHQTPQVGRISR